MLFCLSDHVPSDRISSFHEDFYRLKLDKDDLLELEATPDSNKDGAKGLHPRAKLTYSKVLGRRCADLLQMVTPGRFRLVTVGFGTRKTDFQILTAMANEGNGRFFFASLEEAEMSKIFRSHPSPHISHLILHNPSCSLSAA